MARTVDFFVSASGKCPVRAFLELLDGAEAQKVAWVLQLIEDVERVPKVYFKKLVGTEDIWEVRVRTPRNTYRVFGFFAGRNRLRGIFT